MPSRLDLQTEQDANRWCPCPLTVSPETEKRCHREHTNDTNPGLQRKNKGNKGLAFGNRTIMTTKLGQRSNLTTDNRNRQKRNNAVCSGSLFRNSGPVVKQEATWMLPGISSRSRVGKFEWSATWLNIRPGGGRDAFA